MSGDRVTFAAADSRSGRPRALQLVRALIRKIVDIRRATTRNSLGGAAETFEAAREIINCYHVTFVKGHIAHRGQSAPIDRLR
jgi:hypothetical protein